MCTRFILCRIFCERAFRRTLLNILLHGNFTLHLFPIRNFICDSTCLSRSLLMFPFLPEQQYFVLYELLYGCICLFVVMLLLQCDFYLLAIIGVPAGKFLGCERFLLVFPKNCPKKFWATLYAIFVWFWSPFFQIKARWAPLLLIFLWSFPRFSWIFRKFSQILSRLPLIFPGFSGIFIKSKHLGVRLHPLHPFLLHHCLLLVTSLQLQHIYHQKRFWKLGSCTILLDVWHVLYRIEIIG